MSGRGSRTTARVCLVGCCLCVGLPAAASAQARAPDIRTAHPAVALPAFSRGLEARRSELIETRRDIHRHPEPSGREQRTAGLVADWLREAGFEVTTGIGGHGVVGVLRGGAAESGVAAESDVATPSGKGGVLPFPRPVLAFRADMDAVRTPARDPMEFRSVVPGVHHVCGHDVHTAVGLALATGFSAVRDRLPGTVVLIFQPAEETASGARAMLADGILGGTIGGTIESAGGDGQRGSRGGSRERVPDAIFAYHTAPLPVGEIMTRAGTLLPGRDRVRVEIRIDHDVSAGAPAAGDLADIAAEVRAIVDGVATDGSTDAVRPASEDFVAVRGLRSNATGPGVRLVGATLTTAGTEASRSAREALERGLGELDRPGLELRLDYEEGWIEGAKNDSALVRRSLASARRVLGNDAVREPQSITTIFSEDFGSFQARVPGVMYFLGVSNPDRGWVGMPHSPTYAADEEAIFIGAEVMAAVFLDLFHRGLPSPVP